MSSWIGRQATTTFGQKRLLDVSLSLPRRVKVLFHSRRMKDKVEMPSVDDRASIVLGDIESNRRLRLC